MRKALNELTPYIVAVALLLLSLTCNDYVIKQFRRWSYKQDENMELIYSYLVKNNKAEFLAKVEDVSNKLKIDPNALMAVMYIETAGTFSPSIQNPYSHATGLIQFMPATANGIGTTIDALRGMNNVEQLDYVYKYLKPYRGKMDNWLDTYFAVFFPAAIGKPDTYVMQARNLSAAIVAQQNPGYDLNNDNQVTRKEVETALLAKIKPEYYAILKKKR